MGVVAYAIACTVLTFTFKETLTFLILGPISLILTILVYIIAFFMDKELDKDRNVHVAQITEPQLSKESS